MGMPGVNPPLAKSEWVIGGEKRLIAILLKGIQGQFHVGGVAYNGNMPAWESSLNNKKIAAVASYVRAEWGNNAPEISEAKVAAGRKEFASQATQWTEAQLLQIPADANFPDDGGAAATTVAATPGGSAPAPGSAPVAAASGNAPAAPAPAGTAAPADAAAAAPSPELLAEGKKQYMAICVACHQPTGAGLPSVFPPLIKNEYVSGDPTRLASMILKGVAGPMTVDGKPYNNMMPGQETVLNDAKIAAILTYVRSSFGNSFPPVTPEVVANARKQFADRKIPWTEAELKAFPSGDGTAAPAAASPAGAPGTPGDPAAAKPTPDAATPTAAEAATPAPEAPAAQTPPAAPAAPEQPVPESQSTPTPTPSAAPESANQSPAPAAASSTNPTPSADQAAPAQ
jgi:mono/diheme cytochrome c family protein